MEPQVLTLAGLWNSGPLHWQTQWEAKHPGWLRVPHRDWDTPDCAEWVAELDAAIAACAQPPVLAAHSLSCTLVARWAASGSRARVAGAFLVGPSDVDAPSYPDCTTGFQPMLLSPLPFPSVVVASTNDPYVSIARAQQFAAAWSSRLIS
jgi:predicted alpha/beta hydrolase family esterase